jgi:hypothetical protein
MACSAVLLVTVDLHSWFILSLGYDILSCLISICMAYQLFYQVLLTQFFPSQYDLCMSVCLKLVPYWLTLIWLLKLVWVCLEPLLGVFLLIHHYSYTVYLFMTLPNSRINSWETWFIFNLPKNKQISHTFDILYLRFFSFLMNHEHHIFYTHLYILERLSFAAPREYVRPGLILELDWVLSFVALTLFVLAHPAACWLSQGFIFHTCNPLLTTRQLNTFIQVNIMGAWYSIYSTTSIYTVYNISSYIPSSLLGRPTGPELSCQEQYLSLFLIDRILFMLYLF